MLCLDYTLPKKFLGKIKAENLRIYIQAANLFTITKYTGLDPEITGSGSGGAGSVTEFGIDEGSYPSERQFLYWALISNFNFF